MGIFLKSESPYLYLSIVLRIFWMVQQARTMKQINNKGQNTSICIILKQLQINPKTKANVVLYQIYISLSERVSGLSDECYRSAPKDDVEDILFLPMSSSTIKPSSSRLSFQISCSTPLGVKQAMRSCRRQKPMRQVTISQETFLRVQMQAMTKVIVMAHLVFLQRMSRLMNEQYNLLNLPIPFVTSIRSIQLTIKQIIQILNIFLSSKQTKILNHTRFNKNVERMQVKMKEFNTPPPNFILKERATHGFSRTPSIAQIASYIAIICSIAIYFSSIITLYSLSVLLVLYVLFGVSMIVSSLLAVVDDPTDRLVYYYKWSRHDSKIEFTPEYQKILFCQHCESYCLMNSKHCRACNRCVANFDHHCMWFNNCVGSSNYKYFFISIVSAFGYALVVVIHVFLASFKVDFSVGSQLIKIIFCWIIGLTLLVFGILLFNLIILHIYLYATNQTTYEYLQLRKKEAQIELRQKQKQELQRQIPQKEPSSHQTLPVKIQHSIPKNVDIYSQECFANTKVIIIQADKTPQVSRRVSEKNQHLQEHQQGLSQQIQRKTYDQLTVTNKNPQNTGSQINDDLVKSKKRLPRFLRNNRSLNLLLSASEAEMPRVQKLHPNSSQRHIKQ